MNKTMNFGFGSTYNEECIMYNEEWLIIENYQILEF